MGFSIITGCCLLFLAEEGSAREKKQNRVGIYGFALMDQDDVIERVLSNPTRRQLHIDLSWTETA